MRFFDFSAVRPIKTAPRGVVATGSGMRKKQEMDPCNSGPFLFKIKS